MKEVVARIEGSQTGNPMPIRIEYDKVPEVWQSLVTI
jgi:hypothetical protein